MSSEMTVTVNDIRQIISETDPRKKVDAVIQQLHKDLAEIQKQMETAKREEKIRLKQVEYKIMEAIQILRSGGEIELAADLLNGIKAIDPSHYSLIEPKVKALREISDRLRKLRMQSSGNGLVV